MNGLRWARNAVQGFLIMFTTIMYFSCHGKNTMTKETYKSNPLTRELLTVSMNLSMIVMAVTEQQVSRHGSGQ